MAFVLGKYSYGDPKSNVDKHVAILHMWML